MKKILTSILLSLFFLFSYGTISAQNRAFDNNGQDAYVEAPYVMPFVNTDFTFEAWVYYPAPGSIGNGSHSHTIFATEHSDQRGFVLRYGITSDWLGGSSGIQTEFLVGDGSNWQTAKMMPPTTQNGFGVNSLYNVGWNHIAVVKLGTSITMYLNGKNNNLYLPYSMPGIAGYPTTNRALRIGESYFTGRRAAGPIDEVKIWNVSRTPTEIANDASGETCAKNNNLNTNLVAYYKFNESSGNNYSDESYNNNTATKAGPGTQTYPTVTLNNANPSIVGTLNFASFTQRNDIANLTLDFPAANIPYCLGDSIQNSVSTTEIGLTFAWTPTTGVSNPSSQSATFTATTTSAYTLTATNAEGCSASLFDTAKVQILTKPTFVLTSNNVCFGDTVFVTLSNVLNNTTTPTGFPTIASSINGSPIGVGLLNNDYTLWRIIPTTTQYYYFWNNSDIGCKSEKDSFLITVNNADTITPSPALYCSSSSTPLYTNEAGATAYSWNPTTGLSNSTIQNPIASPSVSTTYTVSITTAAGCVIKRTVQVNVGITPVINGLSLSDTSICENGGFTATALFDEPLQFLYYDNTPALRALSVGDPMYSPSNQIPSQSSPWPRTITVTGLPTNNPLYKLTAIDLIEFNTPDLSDKDIWLVSPAGDTVMITSDASAFPDNGVGNITLTFADYGAIGFISTPGNGISAGVYKCRNEVPNEAGEPVNPSTQLSHFSGNLNGDWKIFMQDDHIAQNANFSGGTINGIRLYFGAPDYTYSFAPSSAIDQISPGNSIGYRNPSWPPAATIFTVTATSSSGCTTTSTANFAGLKPSYTPTITASPNLCTGDTINPIANTSGGTTVVYTSPYLSPYTVGNGKFLPTSAGTYSVIVQESGSLCTAADTILVNVGTNFTLNPITDTTINTGDSARLIASVPTNVLTNVNTIPTYDSSIVVPDSSILLLPLIVPSSEFSVLPYQATIAGIWLYLSSLPSHNFEDSIVVYAAGGVHYVNPPSSLQIGYNYLPFTNPITLESYQNGINVVLTNYSNSSWTLPYKKSLGFPLQLGIYDPQTSAKIDSAQNAISPVGVYKLVSSAVPSSYAWSPAMTLTDPNNDTTLAYPLANTMYTLTATNGGCIKTETTTVNVSSILPITLSNFNVFKTKNGDLIKWSTETETNNSYFTVEHSIDAIKFESIVKVNSKSNNGNSQDKLEYSFEYTMPNDGYNYYRLLQIDLDGKTKVASDVKSTFRNKNRNPISLYPNPAKSEITLEINVEENVNTTIHLVDMTGRKIKTIQANSTIGTNMINVGISELASGIYNVQILENDKLITTLKLEKL